MMGEGDIKTQIIAAIAQQNDQNLKAVLLLMLGVLDEIGRKIDALRDDEKGLREAVLNGHSETHDLDHEWVKKQREVRCEIVCQWAAKKKKAEEEEEENNAASKRKIRDGLIEKAIWLGLIALAGAAGWYSK